MTTPLNTAYRHANGASAVVAIQRDRVCLSSDPGFSVDCYFYAVALRHVVLGVEKVRQALDAPEDAEVATLLATFSDRVPGWRNVRNVVEHMDEYLAGEGHLQTQGQMPTEPPTSFATLFTFELTHNGGPATGDGPSNKIMKLACSDSSDTDKFQLNVADSAAAANSLLEGVREILFAG